MILLRSELDSEFKNKLFDISAEDLPMRGIKYSDDSICCILSATTVQFGFEVSGNIKVKPIYECVRCLDRNTVIINLKIKVLLTNKENIPFNKQDVIHFPRNQEKIDMSETIADIISLAEPMKPICSVNCLGLCPYCGKNLNQSSCDCKPEKDTSPWDVLNKIKSEKN